MVHCVQWKWHVPRHTLCRNCRVHGFHGLQLRCRRQPPTHWRLHIPRRHRSSGMRLRGQCAECMRGCGDDFSSCEGRTISCPTTTHWLASTTDHASSSVLMHRPNGLQHDVSPARRRQLPQRDECGECGGSGVLGCMDPGSCTYNELATCMDDDSCLYIDECGDCGAVASLGAPSLRLRIQPGQHATTIHLPRMRRPKYTTISRWLHDPGVCIYPNACGS